MNTAFPPIILSDIKQSSGNFNNIIKVNQLFVEDNLSLSNSENRIIIEAPSVLPADYTLTLPSNDGNSGEFLQTDGSGALSWSTVTIDNAYMFAVNTDTLGQSIPTGAGGTILTFPTVTSSNNITQTSPTDYTVDVSGDFLINCNVILLSGAPPYDVSINLVVNGGTVLYSGQTTTNTGSTLQNITLTSLVQLTAGDVVSIAISQTSAAPLLTFVSAAAPEHFTSLNIKQM